MAASDFVPTALAYTTPWWLHASTPLRTQPLTAVPTTLPCTTPAGFLLPRHSSNQHSALGSCPADRHCIMPLLRQRPEHRHSPAVVRAMRGVMMRSMVGSLARLRNSTVRSKLPFSSKS